MYGPLPEELLPALVYALRRLRSDAGKADVDAVAVACEACRALVRVMAPSVYVRYRPHDVLKRLSRRFASERVRIEAGGSGESPGDAEQVEALLGILLANLRPMEDASVLVEPGQDDVPLVRILFEGPVQLREPLVLGYGVTLTRSVYEERWTAATHGGRLDLTPDGLSLRLEGVRMLPDQPAVPASLEEVVRESAAHARLYAASFDESAALSEEARAGAVASLQALLDPWTGEPHAAVSLRAVAEQALEAERDTLERLSLMAEPSLEDVPQLRLPRRTVLSVFRLAFRFARGVCTAGGRIGLALSTSPEGEVVSRVALQGARQSGEGPHARAAQQAFLDAMRWCVEDIAGGRFEGAASEGVVTLSMHWADRVGEELDAWLPGWRRFGGQSRQMLRLLFGAEQPPPRDLILSGVLEDELETRLLPALRTPMARNIAHDLEPEAFREPARLAKALTQVRKGKPKKEIARPGHAAELLWAFRGSARHREAAGVPGLEGEEVEALCEALASLPDGAEEALRLLARAKGAGDGAAF